VRMYGIRPTEEEPQFGLQPKGGIGVCGFTSIDRLHQKAEFSLYIQPNMQGRGYGEKALRTLVEHGFKALNLNRIYGEVFFGNKALEMNRRVGFRVEGIQRQTYFKEGKFLDSYMISILKEDWHLSVVPRV